MVVEEKEPERCLAGEDRWDDDRGGDGSEAEARLCAAERLLTVGVAEEAEEKSSE